MKVEVAVLGSPSLIDLTVFVDVKQHLRKSQRKSELRSCVKVEVYGLCGRKATFEGV